MRGENELGRCPLALGQIVQRLASPLDHRLDNPVGIAQQVEIVFQVAGGDQMDVVGVKELCRAAFLQGGQVLEHNRAALVGGIAGGRAGRGDVEQDHRNAYPGQQRRDPAAHCPRSEHGGLANDIPHDALL